MLRRIEDRGALETAHRALVNCGQVFRYGVATGRCERDPTRDLRGALPPAKEGHFAATTDPVRFAQIVFWERLGLWLAPIHLHQNFVY